MVFFNFILTCRLHWTADIGRPLRNKSLISWRKKSPSLFQFRAWRKHCRTLHGPFRPESISFDFDFFPYPWVRRLERLLHIWSVWPCGGVHIKLSINVLGKCLLLDEKHGYQVQHQSPQRRACEIWLEVFWCGNTISDLPLWAMRHLSPGPDSQLIISIYYLLLLRRLEPL